MSLFILLQATAVPSSTSSPADAKTHGSARVSEALGAKHGYRYEVQFPSTQQKNIISNRYQSVDKDKDNDSSASQGSTTLAKYRSGYETSMDSLQKPTLPKVYSQTSNHNNTQQIPDKHYFNGDYDIRKIENNKNYMLKTFLQENDHPSTKTHEVQPITKHDVYLPPDVVDSPVSNESEGYSYEKPSNQFTLPNENLQHVTNTQWYPPISSDNEDDSVEVFPPTESPYAISAGGNTDNQNYIPKSEAQLSTETHNNHLHQNILEQRAEAFNTYNNDRLKYNSKYSLPTTKTGHDLLKSPNTLSSNNNGVKFEKSVEVVPQVSPLQNSIMLTNVNSDEFKPAQIASSDHETEINELSETSLMVHFAGSVFSADGLPHPSKEMVSKTSIYGTLNH